jgi:acyl-coenzyme A synthetase/AMP-(fatty) acid ligase
VVRALARLDADGPPPVRTRLLTATAAYPDAAARTNDERHGLTVIDRYGTAECGPVAQANEWGASLRPAVGVSVRSHGGQGCLEIASDAVGIGYVGERAVFSGHFATADVAEIASDRSFRVLARADRIVRRAGRSVDLARVERLLASLPGVARARVEVWPGALDIQLVARVCLNDGEAGDVRALQAQLSAELEPWERPSRLEVGPGDQVAAKWEDA